MNDLASGNAESLEDAPINSSKNTKTLTTLLTSHEERRQLFGRSLHPDRIPTSQMEPELLHAIAQIKNERMMWRGRFLST